MVNKMGWGYTFIKVDKETKEREDIGYFSKSEFIRCFLNKLEVITVEDGEVIEYKFTLKDVGNFLFSLQRAGKSFYEKMYWFDKTMPKSPDDLCDTGDIFTLMTYLWYWFDFDNYDIIIDVY